MRGNGFSQSYYLLAALLIIDVAIFVLAVYLIQEGMAQRVHPKFWFFVKFPTTLLPLAYAALLVMIPNFAITIFTLLRRLYIRRWPWAVTLLAILLLLPIILKLGANGVWTIIDPGHAPTNIPKLK